MHIIFHFEPDKINYFLLIPTLVFFLGFIKLSKLTNTGCTVVLIGTKPIMWIRLLPGKLTKDKIDRDFKFYLNYSYWTPAKTKFYSFFYLLCSISVFIISFVELVDNRF